MFQYKLCLYFIQISVILNYYLHVTVKSKLTFKIDVFKKVNLIKVFLIKETLV